MNMSVQQKTSHEQWIDLVKGVAILIVILNHAQIQIPYISFYGGMFFVPVFFVLSGYTYKTPSSNQGSSQMNSMGKIILQKAKRLLVPYFSVNAVLLLIYGIKSMGSSQAASKGVFYMLKMPLIGILYGRNQMFINQDDPVALLTIWNSPTWFLPALFLTIVVFEFLWRVVKKDDRKLLVIVLILCILAVLYRLNANLLLPMSLDSIPFYLLLFVFGKIIRDYDVFEWMNRHLMVYAGLFILFIVLANWNQSANFSIAEYGKSIYIAVFNAMFSSFAMMDFCRWIEKGVKGKMFSGCLKGIEKLGQESLSLMCWHFFLWSGLSLYLPQVVYFQERLGSIVSVVLTILIILTLASLKEFVVRRWRHAK